jgi:hypothetical protein
VRTHFLPGLCLASCFLLASACTTTWPLRTPLEAAALNREWQAAPTEVELVSTVPDERAAIVVEARQLRLEGERLRWLTPGTLESKEAPLAAVRRVSWLSRDDPRARGFGQGLAIGALAGVLGGAFLGYASGDDQCTGWCIRFTAADKAKMGAVGLGVLGALVGAIVGSVSGVHEEVRFDFGATPSRERRQ